MPDPVADYLRALNTSDRARAAAWDAVYVSKTPEERQQRLAQLPFSDEVRADLWDIAEGGSVSGGSAPQPATAEQFTEPTHTLEGSAVGRFARGAWQNLNPVTAVKGIASAVRHPIQTASNIYDAQAEQFGKAEDALGQGRYFEAAGHGAAGVIPLIGPAAAAAGERGAQGDVAGMFGEGTGLLAPVVGARPVVQAARTAIGSRGRAAVATSLEKGAASRVTDVMAPKVGPNKTRFGNMADDVAPALAKDLVTDGAPLTREGFRAQIGQKLVEQEAALDAVTDARLAARTFETKPLIDGLLQRRARLTAQAVDATQPAQRVSTRQSPILDSGGKPMTVTARQSVPLGKDVVPMPSDPRVAVIDQAIGELRQLGPVARYEPIRRIRQSYDGLAKPVYSPSMTADYMSKQSGKMGAADVTGVIRDQLGKWDPETAKVNPQYALYRSADDVMAATAEVERVRPRVGRQIAARIFGTVTGGQAGGATGAVAGYALGPIVDTAVSSGLTTQLKTARLMQNLAEAIRAGDMSRVNGVTSLLRKELVAVQVGKEGRITVTGLETTTPSDSQPRTTPGLALP